MTTLSPWNSRPWFREPSILPGFGLTLGLALAYLGLIVLVPLAGLFFHSTGLGWAGFWDLVTEERTLGALRLSFATAFIAAAINALMGVLLAWVLVRYRFP